MRKFLILVCLICFNNFLMANPIDEIYIALQKNDRKKARILLEEAFKNPETNVEAGLLLILLNSTESRDNNLPIFKQIYDKLPSPSEYIFPIWFDNAVTNGYLKKEPERLEFLNKIINDKRVNESIKAGMRYIVGMHYLYSHSMNESLKIWDLVGSIKNWQLVGPFDNSSGSGFNKEFGPLLHPEDNYEFLSSTNSKIKWFTPKHQERDPWTSTIYHIPGTEAVVYAQTFIYSDIDQEVIFALGGTGTLKLLVNDKMIIEEQVEQRTELDIYECKYQLNKGYNRILIQLGYTYDFSYPNFILRILDKNSVPIKFKNSTVVQKYKKDLSTLPIVQITHFAEEFFQQKIKENPANPLNYILLSKVFYRRSLFNKAIETIEAGKKNCTTNILFEYELLINYNLLGNRTELAKQIELIREIDPNSIFLTVYDFSFLIDKEDFDGAEKMLGIIKVYFGENNKSYLTSQLKLDIAKKDYQTMINNINKLYEKYPENPTAIKYKFLMLKNIDNLPNAALSLLKAYLSNNYDQELVDMLLEEYKNQGMSDEIEKELIRILSDFPEATEFAKKLETFYFLNKKYQEALTYNSYCLDNSPFNAEYWRDRAYLDEALEKKTDAIKDLLNAVHQDPNLFDAREKLRELQGKKSIISFLQNTEANKLIDEEQKNEIRKDINYEYIFDRKTIILFKEGSYLSHYSLGIKLHSQKGIEKWKDLELNFNPFRERLIIEQSLVVKKDGKRIVAERNENSIVFPSLEIGDIILVEYRYENYVWGKLSKEFWDQSPLSYYVPVKNVSLKLYAPKEFEFQIVTDNINSNPIKETIEDFVCYKWEFDQIPSVEYESYMPSIVNAGKTVNISSVKSWSTISNWYKDLVLSNSINDYIVNKTFYNIFNNTNLKTDFEKAVAIYNYILDNIKYSHISFRQSNYVPQKPMITISTKLGDCKDLSLLYHVLAKKAGLKTNLVLVNTGADEKIVLPSINFNHCIIKLDIDGKIIYQELTDPNLPFGAMSSELRNSQGLIIPNNEKDNTGSNLIKLFNTVQVDNENRRISEITLKNNMVYINTSQTLTGDAASRKKFNYIGLNDIETKEKFIDFFNDYYDKGLKITEYSFENLEERDKPLIVNTKLEVENEIKSIGGLKLIKIPFFDEVVSLQDLPDRERKYPILYWQYENNDLYKSETVIKLPENSVIIEKPGNIKIEERFIEYQLDVIQIDDKTIKITRKAKIKETDLESQYYPTLREVLKKILKAEDIYIAYKEK